MIDQLKWELLKQHIQVYTNIELTFNVEIHLQMKILAYKDN